MKKSVKKLVSLVLSVMMLCTVMPSVFAEAEDGLGFIKVDLKSQANGVIYMDNAAEAIATDASKVDRNVDFLTFDGFASSNTWMGILTSNRDWIGNGTGNGTGIDFDLPAKRQDATDFTEKETVVVKTGGIDTATINVPDGYYKELYLLAVSATVAEETPEAEIKLSYNGSEETKKQPIYDFKTSVTYENNLESAVKVQGNSIVLYTWMNPFGADITPANYYIYTIKADSEKVLEDITIKVANNTTAIMGLTGNMYIAETKAYAEELLAGGDETVEANRESLSETIAALKDLGISRNEISGIENMKDFVKVDIKSQANGAVYMDSEHTAVGVDVKTIDKTVDFIPYDGLTNDTMEAIKTVDRGLFASLGVPFDIAEPRADMLDLSEKEAIVVKASYTNDVVVNIPDGYYKELYFVGFSGVNEGGIPQMSIKLSYNGSEETKVQPIYGFTQTYDALESAVQIAGSNRIEMCTWSSTYAVDGAYPAAPANFYVYTIPVNGEKVLENITLTAIDNATAIIGLTGDMYTDKTKVYAEDLLAGGEDTVEANYNSLCDMVAGLEKVGFNRSDIAGIENLVIREKGFVKVDIKSQANGAVYMDSEHTAVGVDVKTIDKTVDFIPYDGLTNDTMEAIKTVDRGLFTSLEVPFDIAEPRADMLDLSEKEAIVVKASYTNDVVVNIPDGYYKELYFVGFSGVNEGGIPQMSIKLSYNGSEETKVQPIYGFAQTYDTLESAEKIAGSNRIEMCTWSGTYAENGAYPVGGPSFYVYTIPTNGEKVLENITLTATDNATAILGLTGNMYIAETKAYLEAKIAEGGYTKDTLLALDETVNGLTKAGVERSAIAGIDSFDLAYTESFGYLRLENAAASVDNTTISYSGCLKNERIAAGQNYTAVIGLFDAGKNQLVTIAPFQSGAIAKGASADVNGSFENVDTSKTYFVRFVVLNSTDDIKPLLGDAVEVNVE